MTCLITLNHEGQNYFGGERRLSSDDGKSFHDKKTSKIIPAISLSMPLALGFAGHRGAQDWFEINKLNLDYPFEELTEKIWNSLCYMSGENKLSEILIANKSEMRIICSTGKGSNIFKNHGDFLVAGVGLEIVQGSFYSSIETDPEKKIRQALNAVSKYYPNVVGGEFDIFKIK